MTTTISLRTTTITLAATVAIGATIGLAILAEQPHDNPPPAPAAATSSTDDEPEPAAEAPPTGAHLVDTSSTPPTSTSAPGGPSPTPSPSRSATFILDDREAVLRAARTAAAWVDTYRPDGTRTRPPEVIAADSWLAQTSFTAAPPPGAARQTTVDDVELVAATADVAYVSTTWTATDKEGAGATSAVRTFVFELVRTAAGWQVTDLHPTLPDNAAHIPATH
ncbi:hypothetical protein [Salsipaludibacter albus]|uniref:hypothetical protein n=1 Tax=Salsipaludibacter albus TaxID=2849650 RepID=UPI001EE3F32B|nr:hypothetical protein [Salsipaludibacter albus]MBY5163159.1 hypothetical protein [Salsipaludibacter albus]